MLETPIEFPCGELTLEGTFTIPESDLTVPGVVVCHPHPLFGGSMDNNVVCAVCEALGNASVATLRFNFRGVGRSQGCHDDGTGEQDDAAAAITCMSKMNRVAGDRIGLCGYSFGAGVALNTAAVDERVKALALISPILSHASPVETYVKPKLLLWGSTDIALPPSDFDSFTSRLPEPKEYHVLNGVDHFWWGHEPHMARMVTDFFVGWLKPD